MSEKLLSLAIVVYPNDDVCGEAINKSKQMGRRFRTKYDLNSSNYRPHLSLHQLAIPESQLGPVRNTVRRAASKINLPLKIEMIKDGFSLLGGTGIFWDARKESEGLYDLHHDLVMSLMNLGRGYLIDGHASFLTSNVDIGETRRWSLRKYANPLAIETFWPHITLTNLESSSQAAQALDSLVVGAAAPVAAANTFEITSIHLSEVKEFGTSPGSMEEFHFDLHT